MNKEQIQELEQKIIIVLSNIFDPEIPVSIYALGLIYEINIDESGSVNILHQTVRLQKAYQPR